MTTHRSLNKLEYKAHMSIHNTAEVSHGESHDSAYTRDRLGRTHKLFDGDGTPRLFLPPPAAAAWLIALALFWAAPGFAVPEPLRVSSDELEQKTFNDRLGAPETKEDYWLFKDDTKTVGFNEDGDPNVAMRF